MNIKINSLFGTNLMLVLFLVQILILPLTSGVCPEPKDLDRMSPKNATSSTSYKIGTLLLYECDPGYASDRGLGKSYCEESGEWSTPNIECKAVVCMKPDAPENGKVKGTIYTFGQTVEFECYDGYILWSNDESRRLSKSTKLLCSADSNWNGEIPKCLPIECPELPDIENGEINVRSRQYNGKATYSCDQGFRHQSGDLERRCQLDETWSGTAPVCGDIPTNEKCSQPKHLVNASPVNAISPIGKYDVGTVIQYACNNGYGKINGLGLSHCKPFGKWSVPEINCQPVSCGDPETPENGRIVGREYRFGSAVHFQCYQGYKLWSEDGSKQLIDSPVILCNAHGKWDGKIPKCRSVECPDLEDVPNVLMEPYRKTYGSTVIYKCKDGFRFMSGNLKRRCRLNGTWSGSGPECRNIMCTDAERNEFLQKYPHVERCEVLTALEPGDQAKCTCNNTKREIIIKCLDNGEWEEPCKVQCSRPKPVGHAYARHAMDNNYEFGAEIEYECHIGFRQIGGSGKSYCESSGDWSLPTIQCDVERSLKPSWKDKLQDFALRLKAIGCKIFKFIMQLFITIEC